MRKNIWEEQIEEYFGSKLNDHEADILFVVDYRDHFKVVQRLDRLHLKAEGGDEYRLTYSTNCPVCGEKILFKSHREVRFYECKNCGVTLKPIWARRNL